MITPAELWKQIRPHSLECKTVQLKRQSLESGFKAGFYLWRWIGRPIELNFNGNLKIKMVLEQLWRRLALLSVSEIISFRTSLQDVFQKLSYGRTA